MVNLNLVSNLAFKMQTHKNTKAPLTLFTQSLYLKCRLKAYTGCPRLELPPSHPLAFELLNIFSNEIRHIYQE